MRFKDGAMMSSVSLFFFVVCGVSIAGCASDEPAADGRETASQQAPSASTSPESPGHHHVAPHGGALVELGEHAASIEFVFESASGTLTAYVLDAHAENPVRLSDGSLFVEIELEGNEEYIPLELRGVASSLTGESELDTSQFRGTEGALRGRDSFGGTIPAVTVLGTEFVDVAFQYP